MACSVVPKDPESSACIWQESSFKNASNLEVFLAFLILYFNITTVELLLKPVNVHGSYKPHISVDDFQLMLTIKILKIYITNKNLKSIPIVIVE